MASGLLAMARAAHLDDVFSDAHGGMMMDEPMSPGGSTELDGSSSSQPNSPDDFPAGRSSHTVGDALSPVGHAVDDGLLLSASVEQRKRLRLARGESAAMLSQSVPAGNLMLGHPRNPLARRAIDGGSGSRFRPAAAATAQDDPWLAAAAKGSGLDMDALLALGSLSKAAPRDVPDGGRS